MYPLRDGLRLLLLCATVFAQKLPSVVILSTGGTIASKTDPVKGGYVGALSGEDLVAAVPGIKKVAQIQVEQISNISSSDMTLARPPWTALQRAAFRVAFVYFILDAFPDLLRRLPGGPAVLSPES